MLTRRCLGEEGSATTQLVIATPALLAMLMLIVQLGLWFHASHIAHAAAQEGARAARAEAGTAAAGDDRARGLLDSLGAELIVDPVVTAVRDGQVARVQVTGQVVSVVPGLALPVQATSQGPIERFRPDLAAP